ncbi:MAG TPA: hypothetical protein VG055_07495 [Planctomycetaceae bacterium]|jgi:hypothetical protein|nr:hypothetical protein [Planctomycetaceae bacterium]
MVKRKELTQQNYDAIRNHLFDRIHKTGEEIKNDFPNILRRAIETEAWQHFTDLEGKPFANLVEWLTYTFPNGASMGEGKDTITYEDALGLCKEHPEVRRVLVDNDPKENPRRKKADGTIGQVRTQFEQHGRTASKALLLVRLAQEKPDIYKAFMHGDYGSLRAAAEAAGLVKRANDPLPRLKSFWKRANKRERQAFLKWMKSDEAK